MQLRLQNFYNYDCLPSKSPDPHHSTQPLIDKIHTEEVQYQAPEHKIRKRPLMTNARELGLVLRVRLDAQAGREHELADRGAEAGEEGIEGIIPHQHAVRKLQHPNRDQEGHEGVDELHALRRPGQVVSPQVLQHVLRRLGRRKGFGGGGG